MAVRTSVQAGAWNLTATWGATPPGIGDTCNIGHNVTVTADQAVGTRSSDTSNAIYFTGGPGSLTINSGVTLTVRGYLYNNDAAPTTMQAGSTLEFDVPSGQLYQFKPYQGTFTVNGTSGSRCTIRSKAGGGIANIELWATYDAPIDVNYCDFLRIGDATRDAIRSDNATTSGLFRLRHCNFDTCGIVYGYRENGAAVFVVEDCRFTNSQNARSLQMATATAKTTGTYSIARNSLDKQFYASSMTDFAVEDNAFFGNMFLTGSFYARGVFRRNLLRDTTNGDLNFFFPTAEDNYLLEDHDLGNPHWPSPTGNWDMSFAGNIYEHTGTSDDGDVISGGLGGSGTTRTLTFERNIILPNAAGKLAGTYTHHGNADHVSVIRHNTFVGVSGQPAVSVGEAYAGHAGMVSQYKSNLVTMADATGLSRCHVKAFSTLTDNTVTASGCTHNCLGPNGRAGSHGKGYDTLGVITGSPGTSDLTLGTDPGFVDPTRDMAKWDLSLGGSGTVAAALARIAADPTLTGSSLVPYIRAGFVPTNAALDGTAHDGTTIGAVPYGTAMVDDPPGKLALIDHMLAYTSGPLAWYATYGTGIGVYNQAYNHDPTYAFNKCLEYHPGNADLISLATSARTAYLNYVNNIVPVGGVGEPYLHPEGMGYLWEHGGDTVARDALVAMRNNSYANAGSAVYEIGARGSAYAILAQIEADRLGLVTLNPTYFGNLVGWSLGHIEMWAGDPAVWDAQQDEVIPGQPHFTQAFMMGLCGYALSRALEYMESDLSTTDTRIVPALAKLAFMLRQRHWRPSMVPGDTYPGDFIWSFYPDGHYSPTDTDGSTHALNMLCLAHMGFVYKRTGCAYFKTAGDQAFSSASDVPSALVNSPKEYAEAYRFFDAYLGWRDATPAASETNFYVSLAPFFPRTTVGVAVGPIEVMPVTNFTGTVTPSDGSGGTFTPASLTWSGTSEVKTCTYTPSSAGAKTVSFTNSGTLSNPPSMGFTATAAPAKVLLLTAPDGGLFMYIDTRP